MNKAVRLFCPPILLPFCSKLKSSLKKPLKIIASLNPEFQDLKLYWNNDFAEVLENWGKNNTWNEIQMIMSACDGKILDIACGTGKTIQILDKFNNIEVHGFDISDLLIQKAIEKGIPKYKLRILDATKTEYREDEFNYSYSIGSLEHFTEDGIDLFLSECSRYTKRCAYHMIPVSRSNKDEGWLKTKQSFFNNSDKWWLDHFNNFFKQVVIIPSKWEDSISIGRWFVCYK